MRGGLSATSTPKRRFSLRDGHLDVQLALAREQQLVGLRVARVADASGLLPAAGASRC